MKLLSAFLFSVLGLAVSAAAIAQPASTAPSEDRVMIEAGDVRLGATLYRPAGATGDVPAIVTGHGSAPTTRDDVGFYTRHALAMGFAVLSFDKRGTGESTGTYERFTVAGSNRVFNQLAGDVAASVRWLAEQPGIDTGRIGLFGGSQAGWILPLADFHLQRDGGPEIAFIIIGEGTPLTAGAEQAQDEALRESLNGRTDIRREDLVFADLAAAAHHGPTGYDPGPVHDATDTPTLWIFGLRDDVIPVLPSLDALHTRIAAGQTHHSVEVLPFGDHNFTNQATGQRYDIRAVIEPWLVSIGVLE